MENSIVNNFKYQTEKRFKKIDGIGTEEIIEQTKEYIKTMLNEVDSNAKVLDIAICGSRSRGIERPNSDLDIVFEYEGNEKEYVLFNLLNSEKLYIGDVEIDINPIRKEESGTLAEYLLNAEAYLRNKEAIQKTVKQQSKSFICALAKELFHKSNINDSYENEKMFINDILQRAEREGDVQTIAFLKDSIEALKTREKCVVL